MECIIKQGVGLRYEPVGIILTDEKPETAKQFTEGKWGCVMFMLGAATKGKTGVFDRKTYGCQGGGVGLGFGNRYQDFSFAVPTQLYLEMAQNVPGGFLDRRTWQQLVALKEPSAGTWPFPGLVL